MLTFAIATFFALALIGAVLTIGMMFHTYQDKIMAVIVAELGEKNVSAQAVSQRNRGPANKACRTSPHRRTVRTVPLRAAA